MDKKPDPRHWPYPNFFVPVPGKEPVEYVKEYYMDGKTRVWFWGYKRKVWKYG